jgi:enoyl-CoA hydratase/carnithine racemase
VTEVVHYAADRAIATVTLDSPTNRNALSAQVADELSERLASAAGDASVRAVVLSHTGSVFCAGADLKEQSAEGGPEQGTRRMLALLRSIVELPKPVIARVDGAVRAGGMTIAISCDMIIAGDACTFGYPEIDVGLIPAIHFVQLPRLVGKHQAFGPLFLGEPFDATTAFRMGLLSEVVPKGTALERAREIADKLAAKSPIVVKIGRDAFMRAVDADFRRSVENAAESFALVATTEDCQEGLNAFVEKRTPNYRGR